MRDSEIYGKFNAIVNYVASLETALKTAMTGEAVQNEALKRALIQKGILTEADWVKLIGEVLTDFNNQATKAAEEVQEKAKTEIVAPSAAEVAKIEETKQG